jgi:hypothetical protein
MRFPALALLAFVASGCTIHVVEQPASPVVVAEGPRRIVSPRPAAVLSERRRPAAARPEDAPVGPDPRVVPPSRATDRPLRVATQPHATKPARQPSKPLRIPFKSVEGAEPRTASTAVPHVTHGPPHKVKADEPDAP